MSIEKKIKHDDILAAMKKIKIQRKYVKKYFPFGYTVEHVEKEETSIGYLILLKKTFWNKLDNKNNIQTPHSCQ